MIPSDTQEGDSSGKVVLLLPQNPGAKYPNLDFQKPKKGLDAGRGIEKRNQWEECYPESLVGATTTHLFLKV